MFAVPFALSPLSPFPPRPSESQSVVTCLYVCPPEPCSVCVLLIKTWALLMGSQLSGRSGRTALCIRCCCSISGVPGLCVGQPWGGGTQGLAPQPLSSGQAWRAQTPCRICTVWDVNSLSTKGTCEPEDKLPLPPHRSSGPSYSVPWKTSQETAIGHITHAGPPACDRAALWRCKVWHGESTH